MKVELLQVFYEPTALDNSAPAGEVVPLTGTGAGIGCRYRMMTSEDASGKQAGGVSPLVMLPAAQEGDSVGVRALRKEVHALAAELGRAITALVAMDLGLSATGTGTTLPRGRDALAGAQSGDSGVGAFLSSVNGFSR